MKNKNKLIVFVSFFLIAFIFFRLKVFLDKGKISIFRWMTGLSVHHYHYGLVIILIASLMLIFWKINSLSVGLMGFGLGSVFDSFISRLFNFGGNRVIEINRYNYSFELTGLLFGIIVLLSSIFYLWNEKI